MDCAHCGSALRDGSNFCIRCGTRVGQVKEPPAPVQPAVSAAPMPTARRPPPGGERLSSTVRVAAASATLVLSAITLAAFLAPSAVPMWALNWLLIVPLPLSAHVAEAEMILLIVVAASAILRTLMKTVKRAELIVLALAYAGVLVGNAAAFPGGISVSGYVLGQPGATATWVCLAFVLAAGAGSVLAVGQPTMVAVSGLIAGVVIAGVSAGAVVTQAGNFMPASAFASGEQTYLPVTSSGADTGGSQVAPASSNQPGGCAAGWTALLDVTASGMRATVCQSTSQTILAAQLSDGSVIDVPAVADGSGWSADDGAMTYTVDPDFIATYQNGQLASDQATTSASGTRSTPSALDQLAAMVKLAHQGRAEVVQLEQLAQGCGSSSEGTSLINQVAANRAQLLAAAEKLAQEPSASGLPVSQFVSSMQWSLKADHAWQHWIVHAWGPWAAGGCAGQATSNGRADFDQFVADSSQADRTKNAFVNTYDPIAAQNGLQSNWTGLDI